jgi:hypothetical protein
MGSVDPGLQSLFMLLRQAGIPVGLEEIRRLGAVFAAAPALDEDGLRQVIESVCIKSLEQKRIFRREYEKWLAVVEQQLAGAEARHGQRHERKQARKGHEVVSLSLPALPPAPVASAAAAAPAADDAVTGGAAAPSPSRAAPSMAPPDLAGVQRGLQFPVAPQSTGEADVQLPLQGSPPQAQRVVDPGSPPQARPRWPALLGAVVALGLALAAGRVLREPGVVEGPPDAGALAVSSADPELMTEFGRMVAYRPELVVAWRAGPPLNLLGYGAIAIALGLGTWLFLARGRGRWLPSLARAQSRVGAVALARGAVRSPGGTLLLDDQDEEDLVWGVGRFVSDELSQALDIDRTVHETAAAYGRPVLRYEAARYHREVWLWVDESMDSPVARHLARDLAHTLGSSGLPVTMFTFWGIPTQLRSAGENVVTLDELESQRETAAVAILTDGRLMHTAHRALDRTQSLHTLLRNLSFWPRVTFIDFGRGRLSPIIEPHGLRVIAPQDATAALSDVAEGSERPAYSRLVGDARVWAAACALSPRPVDDPTALKLRQMLGLSVSPWAIETLRENADHRAGGLSWSSRSRADLMGWLLDAEELPEKGLPPPASLLARMVAAWERLLVERERTLRTRNPGWEGSPEQDALRLERAFVHIWDRPDEAASTLYELFHGPLAPVIRSILSEMAPRECADHPDSVPLPWALRHQRRETQVMLTEMGLGARAKLGGRTSLPRPGRLLLALGLCAGVIVGGSYGLVEEYVQRGTPPPALQGTWPAHAKPLFEELVTLGAKRWQARVFTPWYPRAETLDLGARQDYVVRAVRERIECTEEQPGRQVVRCCPDERLAASVTRFTDRWSFAVLPRDERDIGDLATQLLCSGSVDEVHLVESAQSMPDWSRWGSAKDPTLSQLLVVADDMPSLQNYHGQAVVVPTLAWRALLTVTEFDDVLSLAERVPALQTLSGDPAQFKVRGLGACGQRGQRCCWRGTSFEYCARGLACEKNTCVEVPEQICEPDTATCDGQVLVTCDASGTRESRAPCAAGETCKVDRCVPRAGVKPCRPGQAMSMCSADGTAVEVCDAASGRAARKSCPAGNLCQRGDCYPIDSAPVRFDVRMQPGKGERAPGVSMLVCTVDSLVARWRLDPAVELSPPFQTITVPFTRDRAGKPLEIECALRVSGAREDTPERAFPWTRDSEGTHWFGFRSAPWLRVAYTIGIQLDLPRAQDGGAGRRDVQRERQRSEPPRNPKVTP